MAYLALYREWRPKNFKEIVGQDHVKITLTNALLQGKVAHAYLFSGPRGTGKTTAAKILAKALNCMCRDGAEPCNECSSCRDIDQGLALDVLEIDAASNRGIDEIRDLREKVKLAASGGKYKVYIIDEVHMLTTEAFNALLKTLEEPPASVVFVLATTEVHKVPLTILSRVQRFEFHRISSAGITNRLMEVCQALGRKVEEKALQVISVKAEGGLRDALSILDQCLLQEDPVRVEHVYQAIGMVGETFSADLMDALLEGDYGLILAKLEEGVALGRDPRQIIKELLDYLRQALLYAASGQEPLLSPDITQRLEAQSKRAGLSKLLSWINVLLKGEGELRYTSNGRLAAEMILVQTLYEQEQRVSEQENKVITNNKKTNKPIETKSGNKEDTYPENPGMVKQTAPKGVDSANFAAAISRWPEVLEEVKKKKKSTHAFLMEGRPAEITEDTLYLVFKDGYSFHRDKFNQPENKTVVEGVLEQLFGKKLNISNLTEKEYRDLRRECEDTQMAKKKVTDDGPANNESDEEFCVQKAVEFFGAELVQVHKDR
ncbi:MAG: DNA polymerase III subunit gamma/tau [Peptococcaceae bacterium]|nr:DNA polymerase III subunit gamma/tau [Peptococcaceae bacterium]